MAETHPGVALVAGIIDQHPARAHNLARRWRALSAGEQLVAVLYLHAARPGLLDEVLDDVGRLPCLTCGCGPSHPGRLCDAALVDADGAPRVCACPGYSIAAPLVYDELLRRRTPAVALRVVQ